MRLNQNLVLSVVVSVCVAALTYVVLHASLWSTPPWTMGPPLAEKDYPAWLIKGREKLLAYYAPFFCLSSALASVFLFRFFAAASSRFSHAATLSVSWPTVAFPLVGEFGMFAFLFIGLAIVSVALFLVQVIRKRAAISESWILIANGLWAVLLFKFSGDWFDVYGD